MEGREGYREEGRISSLVSAKCDNFDLVRIEPLIDDAREPVLGRQENTLSRFPRLYCLIVIGWGSQNEKKVDRKLKLFLASFLDILWLYLMSNQRLFRGRRCLIGIMRQLVNLKSLSIRLS